MIRKPTPIPSWLAAALAGLTLLVLAATPLAHARGTLPSSHFRPGNSAATHAGAARVRLPQSSLILGGRDRVRIALRCRPRPCSGRLRLRSIRLHHGNPARFGGTGFALKGRRGSVSLRVSKRFAAAVRTKGSTRALLLAMALRQRQPTQRVVRISLRPQPGSPAPAPAPTPAPTPAPAPPAGPHRIKATATYLYDSVTGARFVPRGANYVRLSQTSAGAVYHSTFEPGVYLPAAAAAALDGMRAAGYNTVRVMIDPGSTNAADAHGIGRGTGTSDLVYGPYMDNFANFVALAASRGIYVVPSLDVFPQNDYYWGIAKAAGGGGTPNVAGRNLSYLEPGRVAAKAEYIKQFASGLIARIGWLSSAILAYQADNELYFEANQPPYNKMSGTVKPLNGVTYDMADPAQRQQSADASLVEYSYRVKRGLAAADPEALMTIGFFTNRAVGKTGYDGFATYCSTSCTPGVDYRVPGRPASLSIFGAADFIDVHLYARTSYSSAVDLESVEYGLFRRPWIIGEFGTQKSVYGGDVVRAAAGMRGYQVSTCGLGAQGWLFWTWDTHENLASQPLFFHLDDGGGVINAQLAPVARPDPCRP